MAISATCVSQTNTQAHVEHAAMRRSIVVLMAAALDMMGRAFVSKIGPVRTVIYPKQIYALSIFLVLVAKLLAMLS